MIRKLIPALTLAVLAFGCKSLSSDHTADMVMNETCPMSGRPVDEASYFEHKGTKIYACCGDCVNKIKADPAKAMMKAYPSH